MRLHFVFYGMILIFLSLSVSAQTPGETVRERYQALEFKRATRLALAYLSEQSRLTPNELIMLHQYAAFSYFSLGNQDSSRVHFLSLLSIKSDWTPDRVEVSPKIITFFEQVKQDFQILKTDKASSEFTRYVLLEDPRRNATLRSAIIPGWGQFYKSQPGRGIVLGGLFWSSVAALIVARQQENQFRRDYENSESPDEIQGLYDDYNQWYKIRRNLIWVTASTWLLNLADANISDYPLPELSQDRDGNVLLGYRIQF